MLEALFTAGIDEIKVSGLTQWDKGQKIHITCPDVSALFEVHYTFKGGKEALAILPESDVAIIPDELLTQPNDLVAYVYALGGDGSGETVKTIDLPVSRRAKPVDYSGELTPSFMEQVEAMLASMEEQIDTTIQSVNNVQPDQNGNINLTADDVGAADRTLSNLTDMQKALYNIGGKPRKNCADNPFLDVDQRGKGTYPAQVATHTTYDRWKVIKYAETETGLTVSKTNGIITLTKPANGGGQFNQIRNAKQTAMYNNAVCTLSVLTESGELYSVTGKGNLTLTNLGVPGWGLYSRPTYIGINSGNDSSTSEFKYRGLKYEEGDTQTLAYKDSDGNWQLYDDYDYTADLLECQRYLHYADVTGMYRMSRYTNELISFFIPTPIRMMENPDVLGNLIVYTLNNSNSYSDFTFVVNVCNNGLVVNAMKTGHGLTDAYLRINIGSGFECEP